MQINYRMSFIIKDSFQRFCQYFICTSITSQWLFLGHYILNRTTKKHISEYVCKTCLKEPAIDMGKPLKKYSATNISKKSALIFLPYFFKQVTPRAPHSMVTSGNATKYAYYTNMDNIHMVYWHYNGSSVKFLS